MCGGREERLAMIGGRFSLTVLLDLSISLLRAASADSVS
jgi:hypothetical protein